MPTFMEALDVVGKLVSLGAGVKGIFDSAPTLDDIAGAVRQEVATVFFGAQVEQEIIAAVAALQTAHNYFAINYADDQDAGVSPAGLWADLNSTSAPALTALDQVANTVNGWLAAADDQPAPKDQISKAVSTSLGVYLHMCLLYRERAANAPTPQDHAAQTANMRKYAQKALRNLQSRVMGRITNRMACLSYNNEQQPYFNPMGGFTTQYQAFAMLTDSWFDGGSNTVQAQLPWPANDPSVVAGVIGRVLHAYRRLLWSGLDTDYNELLAALSDPNMATLGAAGKDYSLRDQFIAYSLPGVQAFGKWAASARNVLGTLDVIAMGYPGGAQDDWHLCAQCGGLYYGTSFPDDGTKRCPVGGQHRSTNSLDYVLHSVSGPATFPAGTQPDWCYCSNCYVLFYKSAATVCPTTGGSHNTLSSGNYFVASGVLPAVLGITNAEQGWLWCGNCGGLHSGVGASVCPATGGTPHDTTHLTNYWLSNLGAWPGP